MNVNEDLNKMSLEERQLINSIPGDTVIRFYKIALERGRALERNNINNIVVANSDTVEDCCGELNGLYAVLKNLSKYEDIETDIDMFYFLSKSIERIYNNLYESVDYLTDILQEKKR